MTDVRLTALNPVDSQVYPVACNTSGELLVADGGPDLTVTGDLTVDGTASFVGTASFDGTASFNNGDVNIDSAGRLLVGTTSSYTLTAMFQGRSDGATNSANIRLAKGSNAPGATDSLGILTFSDSGSQAAAQIQVSRDGGTWTSGSRTPGTMYFMTAPNSVSGPLVRLTIDSSGNVFIGGTNASSADIALNANGTATFQGNVTAPNITSLNTLVEELQTKMSLIMRQIDISAETP